MRGKDGKFLRISTRNDEGKPVIQVNFPWAVASYIFGLLLVLFVVAPWIGLIFSKVPVVSFVTDAFKFFLHECPECTCTCNRTSYSSFE